MPPLIPRTVVFPDGTTIAFTTQGHIPVLVVVHGSLGTGSEWQLVADSILLPSFPLPLSRLENGG